MSTKEPAVLIVGAGPCGLVLALTLLQNCVPVRIIDKLATTAVGQRASGITPRSMELYRSLGVLPDLLRVHISVPHIRTCELGKGVDKVISILDTSPYISPTPDCPYLNPILVGQGRAMTILSEHLNKFGCKVEYSTELKTIEQYDDHVVAHLVNTRNGTEIKEDVRVSYLVGADGSHGVVRKQLGLSFSGETRHGEHWVLADVRLKGIDNAFWNLWGDFHKGLLMIRPTERHANDEFWVSVAGHNIDWPTLSTQPEEFARLARGLSGMESLDFREFLTLNYYRINIRMAERFGHGRVFIAGDAAHIHSFTGGQGMNSSIQDAFNLGWKLALAVKSKASAHLLESYTSERIPVIVNLLQKTTELLNKAVSRNPEEKTGDDSSWRRGPDLNQLNINYRGSSVVFDELDPPQLDKIESRVRSGDRAPNAPGIIPLVAGLKPGSSELFDIFSPSRHTALIFPLGDEDITLYVSALREYPAGTVFTVVIMPKGYPKRDEKSESGLVVVLDNHEYCWTTYPTAEDAKVVIVRPDGCVGAIARSVKGVERYRALVFDTNAHPPL